MRTYYSSQLMPVIRNAEKSEYLPIMKIQHHEENGEKVETKWINVSANQLRLILKVLETEI